MHYIKRHWHHIAIGYVIVGLIYAYERGNGGTAGAGTAITSNASSIILWPFQMLGLTA